jgi:hypothetical protein
MTDSATQAKLGGMSDEHDPQESSTWKGVASDLLLGVAAIFVLAAVFFIDWGTGWLFDHLPEGVQYFLILAALLWTVFHWIGRAFTWMERDLERIQAEERAAKAQLGQTQSDQPDTTQSSKTNG